MPLRAAAATCDELPSAILASTLRGVGIANASCAETVLFAVVVPEECPASLLLNLFRIGQQRPRIRSASSFRTGQS